MVPVMRDDEEIRDENNHFGDQLDCALLVDLFVITYRRLLKKITNRRKKLVFV